jgi:hypothetical protein
MNIHGSILEKKKINVGDARKKVKFASNAKNKLVSLWKICSGHSLIQCTMKAVGKVFQEVMIERHW